MIIGAAYAVLSYFLALFILIALFSHRLKFLESICAAYPLSIAIASGLALAARVFLLAGLRDASSTLAYLCAVISLFAMYFFGMASVNLKDGFVASVRKELLQLWKSLILVAPVLIFLVMLASSRHLDKRDDIGSLFSGGTTWGELPRTLGFVESVLHGANSQGSWPLVDITVGDGRTAPSLLYEYYIAALVAGGFGLRLATASSIALLLVSFSLLVYFFAYRFSRGHEGAAVLAVWLVVFSGGPHWMTFLSDWLLSGREIDKFLANHPNDYVRVTNGGDIFWLQTITDLMLPSGSCALAFGLTATAVLCLWVGIDDDSKSKDSAPPSMRLKMFLIAGIILGALAYVQLQVFVACFALIAAVFAAMMIQVKTSAGFNLAVKQLIYLLVPAVALSVPYLWSLPLCPLAVVKSVYIWNGPLLSVFSGPLAFWLVTLGLVFPLSLAAYFVLDAAQRRFYLAFWAVFVLGNLFQFQPWRLENVKLLHVWFIAAAVASALLLDKMRRLPGFHWKVLFTLALISVLSSGALATSKESHLNWPLYTTSEVEVGDWVRANTPPNATVLTAPLHKHPVSSLAGRQVIVSHRGWAWASGADHEALAQHVASIYAVSNDARKLIKDYKIDFIAVGPSESREYRPNMSALGSLCPQMATSFPAYFFFDCRSI